MTPLRDVRRREEIPQYDEIFEPIRQAAADRPFVVGQLGQSLDGRIATVTGESRWINGAPALDHLHRLRANVDAVLVGVGTAEDDDPCLTVRRVAGRNPARVIIDPRGRLKAMANCLKDDGAERIVIGPERTGLPKGVAFIDIAARAGKLCPRAIAEGLYAHGLKKILIEGGAWTVSRFIEAGAIDRLHMLIAPVILGSGKPGIDLEPIQRLDEALRPPARAYVLDGGEVVFDLDLSGRG
jgi:diaminohydroxyphosphoribosylaminopyrimidine deaminase/5-amino-6-(5-phosphoribosylamino)uracil reductase